MGYDVNDIWRVWSDLDRKEEELKWGGRLSGVGTQYNSMGRPASASAHFNMGWAHEQMGRVNRVRKALNDSGPMAKNMIARTLSDIDLSAIWPILVSACQDMALYYGGSAAVGGLIGGVGGAFAGGVGAVPGAAAGAAAGGYVGGWVLGMLGLKSLVEGVVQAVPEALRCYEKGFLEAWGPTLRDQRQGFGMAATGDPSSGALFLANGHVIMISAILSVLAAYVTRGKGDMLKDIRQSARLGPKVAIWVEENEEKLRRHLALQSRGRGASPGAEPPPPKPRQEPAKAQERDAAGSSAQNSKIARDAKADDGANSSGTLTGMPINGATRTVPLGFTPEEQFSAAAQHLQGALEQSGITDATIGVRGSSVTGYSITKGTQFGPQSDIDFFIESQQLTEGYTTSKNIPGFVHPNKILPDYPLLQDWATTWTNNLGRDVTPGAFTPGMLPKQPSIVVIKKP